MNPMTNFKIIMLGPSGAGKSVFLASLYQKLSVQGDYGFFLEAEDLEMHKRLTNIYNEVAYKEAWPPGTRRADMAEWIFKCRVLTNTLQKYSACNFSYLDYAGRSLTDDEQESSDDNFAIKLKNANAILGIIDGQKLIALMRNEEVGIKDLSRDLDSLLPLMQVNLPVHFIITKWDLIQDEFPLVSIRERLLKNEKFKDFIKKRNQAKTPARLIPISSIGKGFAVPSPLPNGGIEMKKISGMFPQPYQVEIPLACVLPDIVQAELDKIGVKKEKIKRDYEGATVRPALTLLDGVGLLLGTVVRVSSGLYEIIVPTKPPVTDIVIRNLIEFLEEGANQKQDEAKKKIEERQKELSKSLEAVQNEETAIKHVFNSFRMIQQELESRYPASNLSCIL